LKKTKIPGDTDSIFIKLPGRSVKEAFAFGEEYCAEVTKSNPPPVQVSFKSIFWNLIHKNTF
jgi:DNA polymerase zeta